MTRIERMTADFFLFLFFICVNPLNLRYLRSIYYVGTGQALINIYFCGVLISFTVFCCLVLAREIRRKENIS
jgi:hypothetical protein